jgi:predicted RNA-binding Zn ribbon-like protein
MISSVARQPRYDIPKRAPGSLRLVQEFLNTRDKEHGREWLDTPEALRRWFADRDLLGDGARVVHADVERAWAVREALHELVRVKAGRGVQARTVRRLNRVADDAGLSLRFDATGRARFVAVAGGAPGALGQVLVRAVIAMVEGDWDRLKTCPNCNWAFYDYSRNRSAKWCSMRLCGNRLKTRSYYRRRRGHDQPN